MNILNKIEYGKRLREGRELLKKSREKFAGTLGIHPNTLKSWENGETTPNEFYQTLIEERTAISSKWLHEGKEPILDKGKKITHLRELINNVGNGNKKPELRIWGVTGAGQRFDYNMQENDPENMKPMELIPLDSVIGTEYLDGFKVSGDSMEPGIFDGAYIGVNFENKRLQTGSLFVFNYPHEGLVVKKIQVKKDSVKIYSYNGNYDPEEYAHAELDEHVIVGRVVWIHNKV